MSKEELSYRRITEIGSQALGWLAGRGADDPEPTHLHWDRWNRRWVPHEDAPLSTWAPGGPAPHRDTQQR
jgi:hypothetical protein